MMKKLDVYIPTRTSDAIEVRIRSEVGGPVTLALNDQSTILDRPAISFQGRYFYRHLFKRLAPGTVYRMSVHRQADDAQTSFMAETLPAPFGPVKLRVGVMSDIHLSHNTAGIEQYRYGTKRLMGLSGELATRYIRRIEELGADVIVFPGDSVDPCNDETLALFKKILKQVSIPCYPVIGNHEPWSSNGESRFYAALGLPKHGYYAVERNGVRLLMLTTPDPDALSPGSDQLRWLETQLNEAEPDEDVVIVTHFALYLQPCVQGHRNDGYQLLNNHVGINRLLQRHSNVRLVITGHKNVPSMMVKSGIIHTLSPQLIQAPCGYDIFTMYKGGVSRTTYEIDEQHYVEVARAAYSNDYASRYGDETERNFSIRYSR